MKTFTDSERRVASLRSEIAVRIYKVQKDARFIEDELAMYDIDTIVLQTIEESLRTVCANLKVATTELLAAVREDKKEEEEQ